MKVLIIKGDYSGVKGDLVYTFYRRKDGMEQMELNEMEGWFRVHYVVPHFDHCGTATVIEVKEGEYHPCEK